MLNSAFESLTTSGWIPSSGRQCLQFPERNDWPHPQTDSLARVPVMSATVLGLEMLLHERRIDLTAASDLILSDVGATIHILRLVGREYEYAAERPVRMGDCLASLDMETWFGSISAGTVLSGENDAATTALWKHSRLIAQYAQLVAESINHISPEEAYMVGLLHEIESISKVIGRPSDCGNATEECTLRGIEEILPHFVLPALRSVKAPGLVSAWKFILASAHELAGLSAVPGDSAPLDLRSMRLRRS